MGLPFQRTIDRLFQQLNNQWLVSTDYYQDADIQPSETYKKSFIFRMLELFSSSSTKTPATPRILPPY